LGRPAPQAAGRSPGPGGGGGGGGRAEAWGWGGWGGGPLALATWLIVAVVAASAQAAPPDAGVLVPERSLGGVRLGWSLSQVEAAWGRVHGRYRDCTVETRYFNRAPFRPEGAGVTLRSGRVAAGFTLGAPRGLPTGPGLYRREPKRGVAATYGPRARRESPG